MYDTFTFLICIQNIQNSTDKSWKTYVIQLRTQSPIGRKRRKTCDETTAINYITV
jgi:hypothetical protein